MWGWNKYVPVAERRAEAKLKMEKLRKKGKNIEPIEIAGRIIAKQFWGKRWCEHVETFSDYSNRLPRGRTYARNGSVCHLGIKEGCVEAMVNGSSLYHVKVEISTLKKNKWTAIKDTCSGKVGSLLELLKGNLSNHVMEVVADHEEGLFPNEEEIKFSCDCPDWADMCKHVAAVLYGIGHRLDERPDLLFQLRGVDPSELLATKLTTTTTETDDLMSDEGLADIFNIDLDDAPEEPNTKQEKSPTDPKAITGTQLKSIRKEMNLSAAKFANLLGVTSASIYRWEKITGALNLHTRSMDAIDKLLQK